MGEPKEKDKPFAISKWVVWEAYQRIKANNGYAGVDEQSIDEFERDLKGNLYKLWNRLSSGSYFPAPVRAVEIPKADGQGVRVLGQGVQRCRRCGVCRERCWTTNWVIDLDIKVFFVSIDDELVRVPYGDILTSADSLVLGAVAAGPASTGGWHAGGTRSRHATGLIDHPPAIVANKLLELSVVIPRMFLSSP